MKIPYLDLGWRPAGARMVVSHDGNQAFVELLDSNNFQMLSQAQSHDYFGGMISGSEWAFEIPYDGNWYVAGAGDGQLRVDDVLLGISDSPGISATKVGPITNADDLVASVTDPGTGVVDTSALAAMVADALHQDPARAESSYADIRLALAQHSQEDAGRFIDEVLNQAAATESLPTSATGVSVGWQHAGYKTLVSNPILTVLWESTESPWNGKGKFSGPLTKALEDLGITVNETVNPRPAGGVRKAPGLNAKKFTTINGAAARDAIADRLRAEGYQVTTEVEVAKNGKQTPLLPGERAKRGSRVIDIQADMPDPADPRNAVRLEVESKAGEQGASKRNLEEAAKDSKRLADNKLLREAGRRLEFLGKAMRPVGVVVDLVHLGNAYRDDGNRIGANTVKAGATLAGGAAGAWAGAAMGASIGSVIPGAGTAIGGVVGGIVGGIVGSGAADKAVDWIKSLW